MLEQELRERAGLDAERLEQHLGILLVLLDGDPVAHEKLLGALVGRDDAQARPRSTPAGFAGR